MHRSVRYTELQSPNEQEHNFWLAETIAIFLYLRVYRKREFFFKLFLYYFSFNCAVIPTTAAQPFCEMARVFLAACWCVELEKNKARFHSVWMGWRVNKESIQVETWLKDGEPSWTGGQLSQSMLALGGDFTLAGRGDVIGRRWCYQDRSWPELKV